MTRIVRTAYRYKRPPGKRKAGAIEGPAVVTIRSKSTLTTNTGSGGYHSDHHNSSKWIGEDENVCH